MFNGECYRKCKMSQIFLLIFIFTKSLIINYFLVKMSQKCPGMSLRKVGWDIFFEVVFL